MKKLIVLHFVIFMISCSSSYTPDEKVLAYKKDMNLSQAIEVLQKSLWGDDQSQGVCGSRGFWYDNQSGMQVHEKGVSLLAHKRGKILSRKPQQIGEVIVFEKQYFKYEFEFEKVNAINIYDDPLLLPVFPECNIKDKTKDYYIIDLYVDDLNNIKFIVYQDDFDKTMAALMIIFEGKSFMLP